jgi:tripartite-type tricarboxylate transporter receptor subunit TctC
VTRAALAGLLAFVSVSANAASAPASDPYPEKPVRLIVPFAAGGTDIIARVVAQQLATRLGKQVVTENRPGAGGTLGMEYVAKSDPNGYTLLYTSPSIAIGPSLFKLNFDPAKAFAPISKVATGPIVFTVHPSLPVRSVKDLIALAKRQPGGLVSASSGTGSFVHLATELFKQKAGIDFLVVQYKGGSEAQIAVLVGDAQIAFNAVTSSLPHVQSGRLRALAFGGLVKSPLLPGVPTIAESGLPGYEASTWNGILVPAGTPKPIVDRLYQEISAVLKLEETRKALENQGAEADPQGPAEFGQFIAAETVKWSAVVRNIK